MTDVPLIRRVVSADRGQKRKHRHTVTVSTEDVIACVGNLPDKWTTQDVAKVLGVSERAVRASVQWLMDTRLIRSAGVVLRFTKGSRKPYFATIYEICPEPCVCDVGLLNQIFMKA